MRYVLLNVSGFVALVAMFLVADILVLDIRHNTRSAVDAGPTAYMPADPVLVRISALN